MKDNYYVIVRDGHNDEEPDLQGPFKSEKAAKEFIQEEYVPDYIFTILHLNSFGQSFHCARFSAVRDNWNWE